MTLPAKPLDLEAVKGRRDRAGEWSEATGYQPHDYYDVFADLNSCIEEVERLRARVKALEGG